MTRPVYSHQFPFIHLLTHVGLFAFCGGEWGGGRIGRTAAQQKQRICQLDDREAAQVPRVHDVAGDAEPAEREREAVDGEEEELERDDDVDEAREQLLG